MDLIKIFTINLLATSTLGLAQSVPVGMPVLEDFIRRQQLLGDSTINASLMIRPSLDMPAFMWAEKMTDKTALPGKEMMLLRDSEKIKLPGKEMMLLRDSEKIKLPGKEMMVLRNTEKIVLLTANRMLLLANNKLAPEPESSSLTDRANVKSAEKRTVFRLMPVVWKQQYTTDHPLSLNDGAMIPARGYQTLFSAGFFAKYGILSVQLMPEIVYARNLPFDGFPEKHKKEAWQAYNSLKNSIDLPDRFGYDPYQRFFWGQSSVRINYKSLSLGVSNENLWWGPGYKNALMMSNTAPGFKHLTFNSTKPVKTPIGSFEWQLVSGRLDGSGFFGPDTAILRTKGIKPGVKRDDWRYLNAVTLNYQPRWLPGLSLGGARSFIIYSDNIDLSNYKTWLPVAEAFLKVNAGGHDRDKEVPSDQIVSVWARWLLPKEHSEIYLEFGRVDHNWHLNDFLMEPAHTRAYIVGFRKLVPLTGTRHSLLDVQLELTQFSHNVPTLMRPYSGMASWYTGGHGFTNQGQILGAGIGTSSNMQLMNVAWVNGKKRIGLELYRLNHDDDFWEYLRLNRMADYRTHWIDISGALVADWNHRNLLFNLKLQTVGALNYMFLYDPVLTEPPYFWDYGKTRYNVNVMAGVVWRFAALH